MPLTPSLISPLGVYVCVCVHIRVCACALSFCFYDSGQWFWVEQRELIKDKIILDLKTTCQLYLDMFVTLWYPWILITIIFTVKCYSIYGVLTLCQRQLFYSIYFCLYEGGLMWIFCPGNTIYFFHPLWFSVPLPPCFFPLAPAPSLSLPVFPQCKW